MSGMGAGGYAASFTREQLALLCANYDRRIDSLAEEGKRANAENAKLRELVRDMWRFTGKACRKYPRLFDPSASGGQTVQLNALDSFEQRMEELGIEVGE